MAPSASWTSRRASGAPRPRLCNPRATGALYPYGSRRPTSLRQQAPLPQPGPGDVQAVRCGRGRPAPLRQQAPCSPARAGAPHPCARRRPASLAQQALRACGAGRLPMPGRGAQDAVRRAGRRRRARGRARARGGRRLGAPPAAWAGAPGARSATASHGRFQPLHASGRSLEAVLHFDMYGPARALFQGLKG